MQELPPTQSVKRPETLPGLKKALGYQNPATGGSPAKGSGDSNALVNNMASREQEVNICIVEVYDPKTGERFLDMSDIEEKSFHLVSWGILMIRPTE